MMKVYFYDRKLVLYDDWSSLAIHVALDNMVITDEIGTSHS